MECKEDSRIIELKAKLEAETQIPSDLQKWVYKGKIVANDTTLELLEFVDGDAIHVLKAAGSNSPSTTASSAPVNSTIQSPPPTTVKPVPHFDQAMRYLLSHNSDEESIKSFLATTSKIISNIINHPFDEKYRKLKSTNPNFQKKIGSMIGNAQVLNALGFQSIGEEWILHSSAAAWDNIVSCQAKLNVFMDKLRLMPANSGSTAATATQGPTSSFPPQPPATQPAPAPGTDMDLQQAAQSLAMSLMALGSQGALPQVPTASSEQTSGQPSEPPRSDTSESADKKDS